MTSRPRLIAKVKEFWSNLSHIESSGVGINIKECTRVFLFVYVVEDRAFSLVLVTIARQLGQKMIQFLLLFSFQNVTILLKHFIGTKFISLIFCFRSIQIYYSTTTTFDILVLTKEPKNVIKHTSYNGKFPINHKRKQFPHQKQQFVKIIFSDKGREEKKRKRKRKYVYFMSFEEAIQFNRYRR